MENKRVYCHTTNFDYINYNSNYSVDIFVSGNWYKIDIYKLETSSFYIIEWKGVLFSFYKTSNKYNEVFSNFFYTEQEYNRIKNLNELLND